MTRTTSSPASVDRVTQPTPPSSCPECDGHVTTTDTETLCEDCGLVLDEHRLDRSPTPKTYSNPGKSQERTGAPLTPQRHDRGLSTKIGWKQDAHGNTLDGKKRRQLRRLRRRQRWAKITTTRDRNFMRGSIEIQRITSMLELGDSLCDQACQLYCTAQANDLLHGRSVEAIATACVYAVCRCTGVPRQLPEFVALAQIGADSVENAYRVLNQELDLPAVPQDPTRYIQPIVSELDMSLPACVQQDAIGYVHRAKDADCLSGRKPAGIAAAAVYLAAHDHDISISQQAVADTAEVSTSTLRKRRDELTVLSTSA